MGGLIIRFPFFIAISLLAMLPTAAQANCSGDVCTNVLVTRVYINGNITYLRTSGDEDALDCDPGSSDYLQMRRTDTEYEDWYALVLTAFVQQAPITFRMESGTGTCFVRFVSQDR